MSDKNSSGPVSLSLLALRAQADTLLEEAGGAAAVKLLDKLCSLTPTQQEHALKIMSNLVDRVVNNSDLPAESDNSKFEDELYNDLLNSLNLADSPVPLAKSKLKLEIVKGGKTSSINSGTVISLDALRQAKRANKVTSIN